MKNLSYPSKTYLVVETQSLFLLSILKEILPNTYLIEIMDRYDDKIRIKGAKDHRVFETYTEDMYKDINILQTIETIPN